MFNFLMSHALRVFESNDIDQKHHFGGMPIHKVKNWSLKNLHLHCLYLFDLNDPAMPKLLNGCRWLPLYYPLFNNACDFSYQVLSDEEIHIHSLGEKKPMEDFPYKNYPSVLPEKSVKLEPLSYEQQKTLVFSFINAEYGVPHAISKSDRTTLKELKYPFTQIGGIQEMVQGVPSVSCPNKKCKDREYTTMKVFAVVWNEPIANFTIWGESMDDSQLIFQICPECKTIYVCNRCG